MSTKSKQYLKRFSTRQKRKGLPTMPQNQAPDIQIDPRTDILIKPDPNDPNRIQMMGPIGNKVYCLGLLQMAQFAVKEFNPQQTKSVQPVPASALQGIPEPEFQTSRK